MKTIPIAVTAIALSAVIAGCGSSGSNSNSQKHSSPSMSMSMSTKAGGTAITIKNFGFTVPASVAPGTKLSVSNDDSVEHTFTLKSAKVDMKLPAGGKVTITAPKSAGTYAITCDFHANMHGNLVVK